METAFLHFGSGNAPRQTVETEVRVKRLCWQERGLQFTASGYGSRIPTEYLVKHDGRWRRVYVACFSNTGSAYLGRPGAWLCTVDIRA